MFKSIKTASLFKITNDMYIEIGNEFVKIDEYTVDKGVGKVKTKKAIINLTDENILDYTFMKIEDVNNGVGVNITYNCKQCNNPTVVFESEEQAQHHAERCLFNKNVNSCVNCKHLKIIEYPPYPRFEKKYLSLETYHAFGAFKQPYCMKKDKNIDEFELFSFGAHDDCYEFTEDDVIIEQTDVFKKYIELIESDDLSSEKLELTDEEYQHFINEIGKDKES